MADAVAERHVESGGLPSIDNVADLLVSYLEQERVEYVFGVPGAPLNGLYRRLSRSSIRTVLARHEAGGAAMAYGYARVTGRVGVCIGTAGPGTTNMITGLAAGLFDGVPMLALTGQVPTRFFGRGALQEFTQETVNVATLLSHVTKYSDMVTRPENLGRLLRKAFRTIYCPKRGPVALSLPANCYTEPVNEGPMPVDSYRVPARAHDRMMLKRVAERLRGATRPVLLVGAGTVASRGRSELRRLAETWQIPVATTQSAKGVFPEDHDLALGVYGFAGSPRAGAWLEERSDLIIVVGSSLGQLQTDNYNAVFDRKSLIQIDANPENIGRNFPVELGVIGDAQVVFTELWHQLDRLTDDRDREKIEGRRQELVTFRGAFGRCLPYLPPDKDSTDSGCIIPQQVIEQLQHTVPRSAHIFWDSGSHAIWGLHYFRASHPNQFVFSSGFAPMGHSIGAAIGAAASQRNRRVVCVTGDGCFMMHGLEISTAVNHRIPVVILVLNNGGMRMVQQGQQALFQEAYDWKIEQVDFKALGESLGADGYRVQSATELHKALRKGLQSDRPTVIDCQVDPSAVPPAFTNANT